jgi:hypothetical protein
MAKVTVFSIVVVLLIGSATLGEMVENEQGFGIGLQMRLSLLGGEGEVSGLQEYQVENNQETFRIGDETWGMQRQMGAIAQIGSAEGTSESLVVEQDISGGNGLPMARQLQQIGDGTGALSQIGDMGFVSSQSLARASGPCEAEAIQEIDLEQLQSGANYSLESDQDSMLSGVQIANLEGIGDSSGLVEHTAGAAIFQSQLAD